MAMLGLDACLLQLEENSPQPGIMHSFPNLRTQGESCSDLRFIHMAFGRSTPTRVYVLSSSLLPDVGESVCDAVVAFDFDDGYKTTLRSKVVQITNLDCFNMKEVSKDETINSILSDGNRKSSNV